MVAENILFIKFMEERGFSGSPMNTPPTNTSNNPLRTLISERRWVLGECEL